MDKKLKAQSKREKKRKRKSGEIVSDLLPEDLSNVILDENGLPMKNPFE